MKFKAYAKLNIGLKVFPSINRYHPIDSIFYKINLFDVIDIQKSAKNDIVFKGSDYIPNSTVEQAYKLVENAYPRIKGTKITVRKDIPNESGLGGGSSDAASTLLGLNKFYSLNMSSRQIYDYALQIGSDVPFFLNGDTESIFYKRVKGRGELVYECKELKLPKHLYILVPNFGCQTKVIYAKYNNHSVVEDIEAIRMNINSNRAVGVINDLEVTACLLYPDLQIIQDTCLNNVTIASLSGSGSAYYLMDNDKGKLNRLVKELKKRILFTLYVIS
jgi:4-diphosphocytidyl-2-C-methyl-D-erythritol kinase